MNRGNVWLVWGLTLLIVSSSFSQIVWQRYEGNPVLAAQADWEAGGNINNTIVKVGNEYKHWFTGIGSRFRIGTATSTDGIHWQKSNANPVLNVGAAGDFDSEHVYTPMVVYHDSLYWMWYAGNNGAIWQIGLATSKDGIVWRKHPNNPVLKIGLPGQWDDKYAYGPFVMRDGTVFKMWYRGESAALPGKGSTGYAESPDGVHWEKYSGNPDFGPAPNGWDSRSLGIGPIIKRNGVFILGRSLGDVNRDGRLNAADAVLTLHIAAGLTTPTPKQLVDADMDGNGRIESLDAICILHRAVGLDCPPGGNSNIAANLLVAPFSASAGNQIETQLVVSGVDKFLGGDVSLLYDANALEVIEIKPSPEMSGVAFEANLNKSGQAQFSFATTSGFAAKAVVIARVRAKKQINENSLRSNSATFFDGQGRRWRGVVTADDEPAAAVSPAEYRLEQNYPNPFYRGRATLSSITQIRYTLPQRDRVKLIVYDLHGRQIRLFEDAEKAAGSYMQTWDGLDEFGAPVATGMYVYRLQVGQTTLTRKLLMLE